MAEQVGKFLTELPELETPTDGDLMYIVDDETTSKKVTMANLKRVLGGNVTGTVEGASVSFSDGADGIPMEECEVTIVPSQDLHGYSKPWAGGAGKNKLPNTGSTTVTPQGITFTVNSDGSITANGKATATASFRIVTTTDLYKLPAGSYIISGGKGANRAIGFKTVDGTTQYNNSGDTSFTLSEETTWDYIFIRIANGEVLDNETFYPMIRTSGNDDWEPYSNICPISGHTDVTVTVASTSGGSGDDTTVSLGRTVYGGTLDVTTGELKVTKRIITENDFTMMGGGASGGGLNYFQIPSTEPQAMSGEAISNMLEQNQSGWSSTTPCFTTNTGSAPTIYPVRVYASSTDLATFKTDYAGLQIVYTLATPQTFNLTPTQVETLLGQNYVSHDGGGNIKVVYIRDLDIVINDLIDRVTALENE